MGHAQVALALLAHMAELGEADAFHVSAVVAGCGRAGAWAAALAALETLPSAATDAVAVTRPEGTSFSGTIWWLTESCAA